MELPERGPFRSALFFCPVHANLTLFRAKLLTSWVKRTFLASVMPVLGQYKPVSNKDKQVIDQVTDTQKSNIPAVYSAGMMDGVRLSGLLGLLLTDLGLRLNSP